jgi:hypothetical protein
MGDATPTWFEDAGTGSGFQSVGPQFSSLDTTGSLKAYLVVSQAGHKSAQSGIATYP